MVSASRIMPSRCGFIGAFSEVVLLYFDWEKKAYTRIPVTEQVEVAALLGDVAQAPSGEPAPVLGACAARLCVLAADVGRARRPLAVPPKPVGTPRQRP